MNIGRLRAPTDDPLVAEFMNALDEINTLAERSPGFVWRLQTDEGNATALRPYADESILINLSTWASVDALADYGGTLIFVSHDRYFVEKLATKIVEVGGGQAVVYPGTYTEFLWHKAHPEGQVGRVGQVGQVGSARGPREDSESSSAGARASGGGAPRAVRNGGQAAHPKQIKKEPPRDQKKRVDAEARKKTRAGQARRARIDDLEARIAETERAIREAEDTMAAPGFYADRGAAQPVIDKHQALMWKVGDLMHQWEEMQAAADAGASADD